MPIRRTRRVLRKPFRSGRKLKQSFSAYGMDRLAAASKRGATGRPFGASRRRGWIAGDKAMIQSGSGVGGGDYSQFTEKRIQTGRKKKVTLARLVKEVRNKAEPTIFRYGGMNRGPAANGFFWCNKVLSDVYEKMPLYMFDLTCVNNVVNGSITAGIPCYRPKIAAGGNFTWDIVPGLKQDGASTNTLIDERVVSSSTLADYPHEKSRLLWNDVRLNLYGATTKAIKWTIQVVKLLDDCLDPQKWNADPSTVGADTYSYQKHNTFYQGLLKPEVYNPLALTSAGQLRRYKVLKTYTTIIQPTSTTESDANPHTKILKWFMRWDRDISYSQRGGFLTSSADFGLDADFVQEINQASPYANPKTKIWLMIRCNDYNVATAAESSTIHGSFDMTIRSCHVPM